MGVALERTARGRRDRSEQVRASFVRPVRDALGAAYRMESPEGSSWHESNCGCTAHPGPADWFDVTRTEAQLQSCPPCQAGKAMDLLAGLVIELETLWEYTANPELRHAWPRFRRLVLERAGQIGRLLGQMDATASHRSLTWDDVHTLHAAALATFDKVMLAGIAVNGPRPGTLHDSVFVNDPEDERLLASAEPWIRPAARAEEAAALVALLRAAPLLAPPPLRAWGGEGGELVPSIDARLLPALGSRVPTGPPLTGLGPRFVSAA